MQMHHPKPGLERSLHFIPIATARPKKNNTHVHYYLSQPPLAYPPSCAWATAPAARRCGCTCPAPAAAAGEAGSEEESSIILPATARNPRQPCPWCRGVTRTSAALPPHRTLGPRRLPADDAARSTSALSRLPMHTISWLPAGCPSARFARVVPRPRPEARSAGLMASDLGKGKAGRRKRREGGRGAWWPVPDSAAPCLLPARKRHRFSRDYYFYLDNFLVCCMMLYFLTKIYA